MDNNQSVPDTQTVIDQMEAMFQKLMTQTVSTKLPTIAAGSAEPIPSQIDKRFDELSKQLKQLEKQTTQRPAYSASVAAYLFLRVLTKRAIGKDRLLAKLTRCRGG